MTETVKPLIEHLPGLSGKQKILLALLCPEAGKASRKARRIAARKILGIGGSVLAGPYPAHLIDAINLTEPDPKGYVNGRFDVVLVERASKLESAATDLIIIARTVRTNLEEFPPIDSDNFRLIVIVLLRTLFQNKEIVDVLRKRARTG